MEKVKIKNKLFKWDGTDVSDIITRSDISEAVYNKKKYWNIRFHYSDTIIYEETCIVRTSKGNIPSLIDELKIVFSLPKIGSQWLKLDNKYYILLKCQFTSDGYILEEDNLRDYLKKKQEEHLKQDKKSVKDIRELLDPLHDMQIREIFAFRELLGITRSFDTSIIMRSRNNNYYPISYYEPNMSGLGVKVIPSTVIEKWFEDEDENIDLDMVINKLVKIQDKKDIPIRVQEIRKDIDKIILRIDPDNIRFSNYIITRIIERVQTS